VTSDGIGVAGGQAADGPSSGGVLDRPVWESLTGDGPQARFAVRNGRAVHYRPEISPFGALDDTADERCWADAAQLVGPQGLLVLADDPVEPPEGWETAFRIDGMQMVADSLEARPDPEAVRLGPEDVPEILDLIARTEPGPFGARTIELGTYLGIRRGGALVAMAGERMHPPGWTEVSAVCTDPAHRGQGLAARLVSAVAAGIEARGDTPCLHVADFNVNAIRLYQSLGFAVRRKISFTGFRNTASAAVEG
jgi:ribosomal protein S18 acetylase RimI-like enzyme